MTANGRDSRVAVVHGCFPEGGDFILSAFSWATLPMISKFISFSNINN